MAMKGVSKFETYIFGLFVLAIPILGYTKYVSYISWGFKKGICQLSMGEADNSNLKSFGIEILEAGNSN